MLEAIWRGKRAYEVAGHNYRPGVVPRQGLHNRYTGDAGVNPVGSTAWGSA